MTIDKLKSLSRKLREACGLQLKASDTRTRLVEAIWDVQRATKKLEAEIVIQEVSSSR